MPNTLNFPFAFSEPSSLARGPRCKCSGVAVASLAPPSAWSATATEDNVVTWDSVHTKPKLAAVASAVSVIDE